MNGSEGPSCIGTVVVIYPKTTNLTVFKYWGLRAQIKEQFSLCNLAMLTPKNVRNLYKRCSPQIGYFYCDCRYFRPGRIDSQVNRVEFFRAPSILGSNKTLKEKKSRKYKQFSLEHKVFLLQCSKFTGKIFKT